MEEIYVNVESVCEKSVKPNQTGKNIQADGKANSARRFHGVVICLGLLIICLLAGLIGLSVYYYNSIQSSDAELSNIKAVLTELLQASENKSASLTEEKRLLNSSLTELAKELNRLRHICPAGWTQFSCACYLHSNDSGSWQKARDDCRKRGADLVVIGSTVEQTFISGFTKEGTMAWIGLTDEVKEGTWKWINGNSTTLKFWRNQQPDNGGGPQIQENCAHIISKVNEINNWNDLGCDKSLTWICEQYIIQQY
ncbi:CD209 antigen-like protein E [Larimichthys crocea]|uniref:CD209 antigen-like protein E n=1 Tax=Larimichthys crocea TaxID=215358 RepID=UPI000900BC5B|nr:CD209 antigen-like protein E [Larimichthys crocea]